MLATINLKAVTAAVLAAMSAYLPVSVPATVDRIEQDGGCRIAVVEIADHEMGDILFCDIDSDTLQDDEHFTVSRLPGEVVDVQAYGGPWYIVDVAVGDEVHTVVESQRYSVGEVVYAYMYQGNLQTINIQHQ